jgi:hypothetical protein
MKLISGPLTIHQRGNPTQSIHSEDDDSGEHSKQQTTKGKVSVYMIDAAI